MWKLSFWTHFLLVALLLAPVERVAACSCALDHPQTHFCKADFVAVVRVKKATLEDEYVAYKVKVHKIFKATPKAEAILKQGILRSMQSDSMCGVNLDVGTTYVVSGRGFTGDAIIKLCDFSERWADVTSGQRKGFRHLYRHGCSCEIRYTRWWNKGAVLETAQGKLCLWESTPGPLDCQEKYGVCMVGPRGCSWNPSVPYKNCIKEYQRQREQRRLREP